MKIGMLGPVYPYRGGIAYFTTALALQIAQKGNEIRVVSFKTQYPEWLYPGESDKDHSPGRQKVDASYLLSPFNPFSWKKTAQALVAFQSQKVIIPWWVTIWGPAFHYIVKQLKREGVNVTFLIHNTLPHEARFFDRFITRRTLKSADNFIIMTQKEKQRLQALLPEITRIKIAPLPIFHAFKRTGMQKTELRAQLNLPKNTPVILFFGFIRPYKGLHVLIDALKILRDQGSSAHLLIVGEFWEDKAPYLSKINSNGLADRVHILDSYIPDDEIAPYFEASDLFVAPYIDGTQSAALKTALGFGLPIVATEVIKDSFLEKLTERCKFVPANDPHQLATAMEEQLTLSPQDPEQINRLVEQSWEKMVAEVCTPVERL